MILEPMGLFATPENMEALDANIAVYSGSQRLAATVAMGVTWNFCAEATKELSTPLAVMISMSLNQGLNAKPEAGFDEWFAGEYSDRIKRIVELGRELARAAWDFKDLPESFITSEIVEKRLAPFIVDSHYSEVRLLNNEMIVSKFKDLLKESQIYVIEQLTEISGKVL